MLARLRRDLNCSAEDASGCVPFAGESRRGVLPAKAQAKGQKLHAETNEWNGWKISQDEHALVSPKAQIPLTRQQAMLMNALIAAKGKSVSIEKIEQIIWPHEADMKTRNSIKVQVSKLRHRIRPFLEIKSAGFGTSRWKLVESKESESEALEPCS